MLDNRASDKPEFRKTIGLAEAVAFGIGGMIGGGIFALSGSIARQAGIAAIAVFILASITALASGLTYAEFSTVIISAGGGYSYVNEVFPEFLGFIAGWWFFLAYTLAGAFYAVVFGVYLEFLLNIPFFIFSLILIIFFGIVNFIGTKESSITEFLLVVFKLTIILIFITSGFISLKISFGKTLFVPAPLILLSLVATVFVAFEGFDIIATLSQETRNPIRNIPRAVIISILLVTLVYILVVIIELLILTQQAVPPDISSEEIILYTAYKILGPIGIYMLISSAIISTMSAYNATLCAAARVSFAMGNNKALPRIFRVLHPRFNTPYISVILSSAIIMVVLFILELFIPRETMSIALGQLASLAFAFSFAIVNFSLVIHRNLHVNIKRQFRILLYPITPLYGMIAAIVFGTIIALTNIIIFAVYLLSTVLGIIYYLLLVKKIQSISDAIKIIKSDIMKAKEALALRKFIEELSHEKWWKILRRRIRRKFKRS